MTDDVWSAYRMLTVSERAALPGQVWLRALSDLLLPLVSDLTALLQVLPPALHLVVPVSGNSKVSVVCVYSAKPV